MTQEINNYGLYHNTPVDFDVARFWEKTYLQSNDLKPNGFWFSIGDEWVDWCKSEMPHWVEEHDYSLQLGTIDRIFIISSVEDAILLDMNYSIDKSYRRRIDWQRLARHADGIIVLNYHEIKAELRQRGTLLNFMFFAAWDVSSGCIWNLNAIKSIEKL